MCFDTLSLAISLKFWMQDTFLWETAKNIACIWNQGWFVKFDSWSSIKADAFRDKRYFCKGLFLLFWEYEYLQHKKIAEVTNNTWKTWNDQKFFISLQLVESWNIRSFSVVILPFTFIISSYHYLIRSWNIISV